MMRRAHARERRNRSLGRGIKSAMTHGVGGRMLLDDLDPFTGRAKPFVIEGDPAHQVGGPAMNRCFLVFLMQHPLSWAFVSPGREDPLRVACRRGSVFGGDVGRALTTH